MCFVQEAEKVKYEMRRAGMALLEEQLQESEERRQAALEDKRLASNLPFTVHDR